MRRRVKREYPPGTFIPTPARILAILQLCLAFTCVIWTLGYPFLGIHFETKSQKLLYEHVLKQEENFALLPGDLKKNIINQYESLQDTGDFLGKMKEGVEIFFTRIPKFELVWILLSIVLPIALLRKREGAVIASWLIPVAALAFAFDNAYYGGDRALLPENSLFPSERVIVEKYVGEPLSATILGQRDQLLRGWQNYLIREWSHEIPSEDPVINTRQVLEGDFAFSVERLKRKGTGEKRFNVFREKRNPFVLWVYVLWNLFFAVYMNYKLGTKKSVLIHE